MWVNGIPSEKKNTLYLYTKTFSGINFLFPYKQKKVIKSIPLFDIPNMIIHLSSKAYFQFKFLLTLVRTT